tara:strand:+ start:78507 stop:79022 length:516 start_codon:yes stop_codon:yes gene_type:complete
MDDKLCTADVEVTPRKRMHLILFSVLIVAFLTSGCEQRGQKETISTIAGAALGGLLGSQFGSGKGQLATTGLGVLLGALAGSEIGRSLDDVDRMKTDQAARKAQSAPIGQKITWNNPDSGNSGSVTPVRDGTSADGLYCREFRQSITVEGKMETSTGLACRRADGTWRIVE